MKSGFWRWFYRFPFAEVIGTVAVCAAIYGFAVLDSRLKSTPAAPGEFLVTVFRKTEVWDKTGHTTRTNWSSRTRSMPVFRDQRCEWVDEQGFRHSEAAYVTDVDEIGVKR